MPRFSSTRDFAPGVGRAGVLPRVLGPGIVAEFAGQRDGVELPHQLAGEDVEGAQIAGRGHVAFAGGRAENDQVLENLARDYSTECGRMAIPGESGADRRAG